MDRLRVIVDQSCELLGVIGNCSGVGQTQKNQYGIKSAGNTYRLGFCNPSSTLTVSYQARTQLSKNYVFVQFVVNYFEGGTRVTRVTTGYNIVTEDQEVVEGIDQEALIAFVSKYICLKGESLPTKELQLFLNSQIVRFMRKFCKF